MGAGVASWGTWGLLGLAIASEVMGTSLLPATERFTRPGPTLLMALCYGISFYLLSIAVRVLPVGVVYAIWSGLGMVLVSLLGWAWLGQRLDPPAILGIGLILAGVIAINLSGAGTH